MPMRRRSGAPPRRRSAPTLPDWPGTWHERHPGHMDSVPIVVHQPSPTGGRRVTMRRQDREQVLGTAYSDYDLVVFLEATGVVSPANVLDDPQLVQWSGAGPHEWHAA